MNDPDLKVLIVDDEPLAVRRLEIALSRIEGAESAGTAGGVEDALEKFAKLTPDVVLLDIRMRDGTGFDFLERLSEDAAPAVILVTAYDDYAIRAFEASVADYVLKPVETARLAAALARARKNLAAADSAQRLEALKATIDELRARLKQTRRSPADDIWAHGVGGHVRIAVDDIEFARSEGEYVRIHAAGRSHLVRLSMRRLEEKLPAGDFIRVHRSALARIESIRSFRRKGLSGGEVLLRTGELLPAGRVYAQKMRASLIKASSEGPEAGAGS